MSNMLRINIAFPVTSLSDEINCENKKSVYCIELSTKTTELDENKPNYPVFLNGFKVSSAKLPAFLSSICFTLSRFNRFLSVDIFDDAGKKIESNDLLNLLNSIQGNSYGLVEYLGHYANLNLIESTEDSRTVLLTGIWNNDLDCFRPLTDNSIRDILNIDSNDRYSGVIGQLARKIAYAEKLNMPILLTYTDAQNISLWDKTYKSERKVVISDYFFEHEDIFNTYRSRREHACSIERIVDKLISLNPDIPNYSKLSDNQRSNKSKGFGIYFLSENYEKDNALHGTASLDLFSSLSKKEVKESYSDVGVRFRDLYNDILPDNLDYLQDNDKWVEKGEWNLIRNKFLNNTGFMDKPISLEPTSLMTKLTNHKSLLSFEVNNVKSKNIIISGPTGCGKTEVVNLLMLHSLLLSPKSTGIYIGPLKSLVHQIYEKWEDNFKSILKPMLIEKYLEPLILSTGDYNKNDYKFNIENNYDYFKAAFLVNEKASLFATMSPYLLKTISVVVIDEMHMISDPSRGAALENFILKLRNEQQRRQDDEPPLNLIFVTTESTNELKKILTVRGDKPYLLETETRPIKSTHYLACYVNEEMDDNFDIQDSVYQICEFKTNSERELDTCFFDNGSYNTDSTLPPRFWHDQLRDHYSNNQLSTNEREILNTEIRKNNERNKSENIAIWCKKLLELRPERKSLMIVCNSINLIDNIAKELLNLRNNYNVHDEDQDNINNIIKNSTLGVGIASARLDDILRLAARGIFLHSSDFDYHIKKAIESIFSKKIDGDQKIIIATESLAYGVNLNTDMLVLSDVAFPRDYSSQNEQLTAMQFHNIVGRAGRYGLSSSAEVYILYSLSVKYKNISNFLKKMYCRTEKKLYLKSSFLTGGRNLRQAFNKIIDEGSLNPAVTTYFNDINSRSFLSCLWHAAEIRGEIGEQNPSANLAEVLELVSKTFFADRFKLVEGLNDYRSCFNDDVKENEKIIGEYLEYILGHLEQYANQSGINLVNKTAERYRLTKKGESILATGTNIDTAKVTTFWMDLLTLCMPKEGNLPLEIFIPALIQPNEVFNRLKSFALESNYRNPTDSGNGNTIPKELAENICQHSKKTFELLMNKILGNGHNEIIRPLMFLIEYSIDGDIKKLQDNINIEALMPPPEINLITDYDNEFIMLSKSICYRLCTVILLWINDRGIDEIEMIRNNLPELDDHYRVLLSKDSWRVNYQNIIKYKGSNLLNYHDGLSIMKRLEGSSNVAVKRLRFGCTTKALPIADALKYFPRNTYISQYLELDGYKLLACLFDSKKFNSFFTVNEDDENNPFSVDNLKKLLFQLFIVQMDLMKVELSRNPGFISYQSWKQIKEHMREQFNNGQPLHTNSLLLICQNTAQNIVKDFQHISYKNSNAAFLLCSVDSNNQYNFYTDDDDSKNNNYVNVKLSHSLSSDSTRQMTFYAFLIMLTMIERNFSDERKILDQIFQGNEALNIDKMLSKEGCWEQGNPVFQKVKNIACDFYEPKTFN